ncbi:FecR family protein [Pedobacter psychroterrae]|uniref:FecR family protein n=1 Tax=Pedobacter psychroterrae TaxID=2530453 RepID=A0A4R0NKT1_9SPHI|nr:FecR family protein [Pedobacter psychroterrae]TCD01382.1 FecR family protein [Pedobacter psychroterrae]
MTNQESEKLLKRYSSGEATDEEVILLLSWIQESEGLENPAFTIEELESNKFKMWQKIMSTNKSNTYKKWWPSIAIAASFALIVSAGLYSYKNWAGDSLILNDIAPGKNTATLTLSNGSKINLSDVVNGKLATQHGVTISKTKEGELRYQTQTEKQNLTPEYNSLTTANGQQYELVLPDQTKVWLNSTSVLKFPASFMGLKDRTVELLGEAYFEVSKDQEHPFIVKTAEQDVIVLGTHFNLNSYADEQATTTTLLEGSVKVLSVLNHFSQTIKPGEKAVNTGKSITVEPANLQQVTAWKNGFFRFTDESLESILRQISRWYDVKIVYEGNRKDFANLTFLGVISRDKNLSTVLKTIERTDKVRFTVKGKIITVKLKN